MAAAAKHPPGPLPMSVRDCHSRGVLAKIRHSGYGMSKGREAHAGSRDLCNAANGLLTAGWIETGAVQRRPLRDRVCFKAREAQPN